MVDSVTIAAQPRERAGKGAARATRRAGRVPGVIYGEKQPPQLIDLDPKELVDEAFLRRIKYKIEVGNPDEAQYRAIFRRVCEASGVPYVVNVVTDPDDVYPRSSNLA